MGWVGNATPRPLYLRERPGTPCIGGWVGPRAGLVGCRKSRPPLGFDPRTVQPVACRYTDWPIPTHPCSVGTGSYFPRVKQPRCEADHSLFSSARIKNVWNCSAMSPYTFLASTPVTLEENALCRFSDIFRIITCSFSWDRRMSEQFPVVFVEIPKITAAKNCGLTAG